MGDDQPAVNTDVEIWRKPGATPGMEYYEPSIHVTAHGAIGINVGGSVYVLPVERWHELAAQNADVQRGAAGLRPLGYRTGPGGT